MSQQYRPPVVVVLGHVDHGKTTLLDYIRKTTVTAKEAGGITQSIGAYEAETSIKGYHTTKITFIDTPGHEAFTKLRMRGAQAADIAILIVDATASVMPQTIESISHIKEAGIPFIVAMNKVDLQTANISRVKQDLAKHGVQVEGFGGTIPVVEISAKAGTGINDLLEGVLYIASEKELTYDDNSELEAFIIETQQEKSGITASCIIKNGMLKVAETIFAGQKEVKIRALLNDRGMQVKEVRPSMPFVLVGFKEAPEVGAMLTKARPSETAAPQVEAKQAHDFTGFFEEEGKKLRLVIKADAQGSLEALLPALAKSESIEIILSGVGDITNSDIFLAKVAKAVVIGFNVKPSKQIEQVAGVEKVVIKTYNIIYKLLEELTEVSDLLKEREDKEKSFKGEAKIVTIFTIDGSKIAGVKVLKGRLDEHDRVEVFREGRSQGESLLSSIKQRAKSVKKH
ncbi:MAG: Translation initiation factor IF-2 [Microgenomates bacterium OLB23]|nr:MAG: Translation initiation factor IF-2 [Microgenomates bacterium OLB23]